VDVGATYKWSAGRAGDYNFNLNYTYLDEYFIGISDAGAELKEDWAGAYGILGALPHHRGNLTAHWAFSAQGLTAQFRYVRSYFSPRNLAIDNVETDTPFEVDTYT
jgi:hypothetical protein